VVPALDPSTPVFCGPFVMKLVKRRMSEFSLFNEDRFKVFEMNQPFKAGPFEWVRSARVRGCSARAGLRWSLCSA